MQGGVINIKEFMQHLKDEGLVIVRADEIGLVGESKLNDFRRRMMRRNAISFSDFLKMKLIPITTRNGLQSWAEKNLKENEFYKGTAKRMIMTSAITRLGIL